ncbi:MAG: hypothetical protein KGP29_01140 [Proteobacteria bacterium]|nr:hypothetical protein [Pseudomonadota bacterium]
MMSAIFILKILSPTFGFIGTVLIFFFGVPKRTDTGGKNFLALEQEDEEEKAKIKKYKFFGNLGLILIAIGFAISLILVFFP